MAPIFRPTIISFVFVTFITILLKSARSQDIFSMTNFYMHTNCSGDGQFDQASTYQENLHYLLSNLTSKSGSQKFNNLTTGEVPNKVYGLYQCYYGTDNQLCQNCIQDAQNRILQNCNTSVEAIIWYQLCTLRYADHNIFATKDVSKYHVLKGGPLKYSRYNQHLSNTFISLFDRASSGCSPFASGTTFGILEGSLIMGAEVQCTPDLSESDCNSCLRTALRRFDIQGHQFGIIVQPSCQLFYGFIDVESLLSSESNKSLYIGIGITSGIAGLDEIESIENLHIELDAIKAATNDFSEDKKLGEGGFGIVYMGTLEDGQAVAVKRLSNASKQGVREFKTEACLAAKLQHNNLVKVYGFCSESDEMLLVYEFVPNKSLDRLLYDVNGRAHLKWETRYKIIEGIARGLLYLHEDSSPKIIHRDLKPSNILLDGEMNPKIADFGMAKLFRGDQSQGNTSRIAGTFGYMAPEYLASGHISIKSDIFSYGVILLEIISGLKNRFSDEQEENLLSYAWNLWNEGKHLNLVDSTLGNSFSTIGIKRCIHVGLLCTQEDPSKRPNMASILIMLNTELSIELSSPTSPPIFPYKQETTISSHGSVGIAVEDVITELSPR
ncbi:Cysteine-rich receptor-like protein kinase 8 [Bienertia sinuspersici]